MKQTLILFLLTAIALPAFAQQDAISRYFEKYMDDERFTMVYISPKVFQMVARMENKDIDEEVMDIISDLQGLRILTSESEPLKLYEEAVKKIDTKEYEPLMLVREGKEENVQFLIKEDGDMISELLMLVGSPDDFVLMSFIGLIDLNKISKLSEGMDIQGMEHLKEIENKEGSKSK